MPDNKKIGLQYRWKVVNSEGRPHLLYYGVRNPPLHREQFISISSSLADLINKNIELPATEEIENLVEKGVFVPVSEKKQERTPETMQVCVKCVNNDYVIPGLEFNTDGVCALCQCYEQTIPSKHSPFATVTGDELRNAAAVDQKTRFDAMVLYTGGKDSSYLLWLLARKLGLRVLAAFWNMPWCSNAAYKNIERARKKMPEVEFVEWTLPAQLVRRAMTAKWRIHGWPCLCPSAAFPMLYPLARQLRIPYILLGIEDVQASVMDYVFPSESTPATKPTPREQTIRFLKARALPRSQVQPLRWTDEMANYHAAVNQAMPDLFADLADIVKTAQHDTTFQLPLIVRLNTNNEYGSWKDARDIIEREMDWRAPAGQNSLLHTSCAIEPVKDYLQFQRFKAMRTVFMPQSIVETSAAVFFGMTSRKEALEAVEELGYWQPPEIINDLVTDLGITSEDIENSDDELHYSMREWA